MPFLVDFVSWPTWLGQYWKILREFQRMGWNWAISEVGWTVVVKELIFFQLLFKIICCRIRLETHSGNTSCTADCLLNYLQFAINEINSRKYVKSNSLNKFFQRGSRFLEYNYKFWNIFCGKHVTRIFIWYFGFVLLKIVFCVK